MASSKASIEAGRGHVTLSTDKSQLEKGLDEAAARFRSWGTAIMAIGASVTAMGSLVVGPILAFAGIFAEVGDDMAKMATRTGVTVEALSELRHAAGQSGATAEDLEKGFVGLAKFMDEAGQGSASATRRLNDLGLSFSQLGGMSRDQQIEALADAISRVEDPAQRTAIAMDIFGKSGNKLMPMLMGGAAGIQQLREEARRLGLTMSTEDAQAAEAFGDAMSNLKSQSTMLMFHIGAALAPTLTSLMRNVSEVIGFVIAWTRENRGLFLAIFAVGVGIMALGAAITFIGGMVYAASFAFTFMSGAIGIVGGVISTFISLASGGFGLLTVLSWGWGAVTFTAGMLATGALLAYKVGLLALTAISWAWNAAGVALAAVMGLFSGAAGLATGATGGYTLALIGAWIWENIASVGITLLITALGLLVIAIGAVVLALAGFLIFGVAVAFLPAAISFLVDSFHELWGAIADSTWFANLTNMFGAVISTAQTAWAGIKAAFDAGEWGLIWEILKVTALLQWQHISTYLLGVFYYWKDLLSDVFDEAWTYIKVSFISIWGEIKALFFLGVAAIASGFTGMVNVIIIALNGMLGAVAAGMNVVIDMINSAVERLPQSVRNTIGISTLARVGTGAQLQQVADGGQRFRDMAQAERQSTREQVEAIESQAMADWFAEQALRVERDTALAEGNQARVAELTAELEDLTAYAEFLRDAQPALAGAGQAMREGPGMANQTTRVSGSFSADVIAGFIGASMGAGETRGERETRMARERLDEILRELERRPGVVMG